MKRRTIALLAAIFFTALFVMSYGAYLKYEVLQPLGIAQDKSIMELPFLMMADDALRYEIELAVNGGGVEEDPTTEPTMTPTAEPSTEPTTVPTESTTVPTEPTTVPTEPTTVPTEPTTVPTEPTTVPTEPTTVPTEPPTVPTEPPTEPTIPPTEPPTDPTEPTGSETEPSTEPHEHAFVLVGSASPTCINNGFERYACECGEQYTNTIPAAGHKYAEEVVPPTCTSEGYSLFVCTVCGDSYQDKWMSALEHPYVTVVVAPTPTANGYTEHTCTSCGAVYRDQYTQYDPNVTYPTEPPVSDPTTPPETDPTTPPETEPTTPPETEPIMPPETEPTTPPETEPTIPPETTAPPSYSYPGYDFSVGAVPDSWYDDVLFIGDSRTVGLRDYARSGNAEYFCGVGMTVFTIQTTKCSDTNFSKQTLESLLSSKTYGKVFINLGINECGYSTNSVISAYQELINLIRKHQPNAKIILQSIIPVSKGYSDASYFKPAHIASINDRIYNLSDGATVFYIDANPYFTDAEGYLYRDITGDGCHFYANYYVVWAQWISYAVGRLGI